MNMSFISKASDLLSFNTGRLQRVFLMPIFGLALFASTAKSQSFDLSGLNEISDEKVFYLVALYESHTLETNVALEKAIKLKISTLERRIRHLNNLKKNSLLNLEEVQTAADEIRAKGDKIENEINIPTNEANKQAGSNALVLSVDAADALYLQSQTERQRVSWEIAAEEATLEQLKNPTERSQVHPNIAVLEGKIRIAEVALNSARILLENQKNLREKNVISSQELQLAEFQYQTRAIELDIAQAELRAQAQQGTLSNTDAIVKSSANLAQLKARDQVLKLQIDRLAAAKREMAIVEQTRSEAAAQLTRANRFRDLLIDQQMAIDELESLKDTLQAALASNAPNQDEPKSDSDKQTP